ncbi:MAG: hypothetical protein ACI4QT_04835 [Kiritimatiellia bacterium]
MSRIFFEVSICLLAVVVHAECQLSLTMRACIDSPSKLFQCEIVNTTDHPILVERLFETGNSFTLKRNSAKEGGVIPLGCSRRWGRNGPPESYFIVVPSHGLHRLYFERYNWPENCVGWYDVVWKLTNRFSKGSWTSFSCIFPIGMQAEKSFLSSDVKPDSNLLLTVSFGKNPQENVIVLVDGSSQMNEKNEVCSDVSSEHFVVTSSFLKQEIMIPVDNLRKSHQICNESGICMKCFQWTDIAKFIAEYIHEFKAENVAVNLQWRCGDKESSILPLWFDEEK